MPPRKPARTKKPLSSATVITETEKLDAQKLLFLRDRLQRAKLDKSRLEKELAEERASLETKEYGPESLALTHEIIAALERGIAANTRMIDIVTNAICELVLEFPEEESEA